MPKKKKAKPLTLKQRYRNACESIFMAQMELQDIETELSGMADEEEERNTKANSDKAYKLQATADEMQGLSDELETAAHWKSDLYFPKGV